MADLVETLRPNEAGSNTNLDYQEPSSGEHWDKVDEESPDDVTTYIGNVGGSVGVYQLDTYAIADHSIGSGTINSVRVYCYCTTDTSGRHGKVAIRTHSTNYEDVAQVLAYYPTWGYISKQWTVNPNTGSAWTWAEVDALEAGLSIELRGNCTQVYVEVDYTAVVGWTGKIMGVTNPAKIMGVDVANIAKVKGVASA